jgi:hypothetical protein
MLGTYIGQCRLVIVEDQTASLFASELLARFGELWGQSVEVVSAGGADGVVAVCRRLPRTRTLRVVGLLDADQSIPEDCPWPVKLLPGQTGPESFLREVAINSNTELADRLGRGVEVMEAAAQAAAGCDAHDWFPEVAGSLMVEHPAVVRAVIHIWLSKDDNETIARELTQLITEQLVG